MSILKIEDYKAYYELYFKVFDRFAIGEYAEFSYGVDKPNPTASSLESIIAYANYILTNYNKNDRILNAGSGASSWMLRNLFNNVIDIEPNKKYAEFISLVCGYDRLAFISNWADIRFNDHCYYDYGSIERLPYLGCAIENVSKSIFCDDTDCRDECMPYRKHVIALCEAMGFKWFDCEGSKDEHGRSGIIIEK